LVPIVPFILSHSKPTQTYTGTGKLDPEINPGNQELNSNPNDEPPGRPEYESVVLDVFTRELRRRRQVWS
jgi:hypothetical protein